MKDFFNVFFAALYENIPGGYMDDFSQILFDNYVYFRVGIWMLITSLIFMVILYYILNSPKLNNWFVWVLFLIANAIINYFWIGKSLVINIFEQLGLIMNYEEHYFSTFALNNALYSILFFLIFSFSLRYWSRNCSRTPF